MREVSRFMVRILKEDNFFRGPLKTLLGVKRKIASMDEELVLQILKKLEVSSLYIFFLFSYFFSFT